MRLEPRTERSLAVTAIAPVAALAVSLGVSALLVLAWGGIDLGKAVQALINGSLGSPFALAETLTRATPLIFTGLAAAVAFRAKFWNIGAEGQFYAGAMVTIALGTGAVALPSYLLIPVLVLASAAAGALLLLGPALLKARFGVDEVVTTLLLNFIVILFVGMMLEGPLKDPMGLGWPQSEPVSGEAELPKLWKGLRLHAGFLIACALAVAIWIMGRFSVLGFEIRALGHNLRAARFAGVPVTATVVKLALISGGVAGIAGFSEVAGLKGNLTQDLSPGFGYTGIVVAMLAYLHPLGVVLAGIFVAGIFVGADAMSRTVGVSNYIADVMVATSLLCMLVAMFFSRYRIRRG